MKVLILTTVFLAALLSTEARIQSRITGGFSARSGMVKCYVSMIITGENLGVRTCGGCLLPRSGKFPGDRILTSAGCLFNAAEGKAVNIKFYLSLSGPAGSMVSMRIKDIYKNVEFNPASATSGADIAQVVLEKTFSSSLYNLEPAFPSTKANQDAYVGENLFVCGHGFIDNNRTAPGFRGLQCTYLRVVPVSECAAAMPAKARLPKGIICTKNDDASNVCTGDQGSPVFSNKTGQLQLVGVVSFFVDSRMNARCEDGHLSAITQVGYHSDFVKDPTFIPAAALTTAAPKP
jgi:secreted trypsin-like serine protease